MTEAWAVTIFSTVATFVVAGVWAMASRKWSKADGFENGIRLLKMQMDGNLSLEKPGKLREASETRLLYVVPLWVSRIGTMASVAATCWFLHRLSHYPLPLTGIRSMQISLASVGLLAELVVWSSIEVSVRAARFSADLVEALAGGFAMIGEAFVAQSGHMEIVNRRLESLGEFAKSTANLAEAAKGAVERVRSRPDAQFLFRPAEESSKQIPATVAPPRIIPPPGS